MGWRAFTGPPPSWAALRLSGSAAIPALLWLAQLRYQCIPPPRCSSRPQVKPLRSLRTSPGQPLLPQRTPHRRRGTPDQARGWPDSARRHRRRTGRSHHRKARSFPMRPRQRSMRRLRPNRPTEGLGQHTCPPQAAEARRGLMTDPPFTIGLRISAEAWDAGGLRASWGIETLAHLSRGVNPGKGGSGLVFERR